MLEVIKKPAMIVDPEKGQQYIYNVANQPIVGRDALAAEIVRQGTTVRSADVRAVLDNLGIAVAALLTDGKRVEIDGLGYISLAARGVTEQEGTAINGDAITVVPKFRFYRDLCTKVNAQTPLSVVAYTAAKPEPAECKDAATGLVNQSLTPGGMAGLSGYNLQVNVTKSDEGVWFMPPEGSADVAMKVAGFLDNKPARLTFLVPTELTPGTAYYVEVRNRQRRCRKLQIGRLGEGLTVG